MGASEAFAVFGGKIPRTPYWLSGEPHHSLLDLTDRLSTSRQRHHKPSLQARFRLTHAMFILIHRLGAPPLQRTPTPKLWRQSRSAIFIIIFKPAEPVATAV